MDISLHKVPPQVLEFEESILTGCLLYSDICDETIDILVPEDFYKTAHQKIYKAILDLKFKKEPVDLLTVSEKLRALNALSDVGGVTYLATLVETCPVPTSTEHTIQKIRECAVLRKTIELCNKTIQNCFNLNDTPEKTIDQFQTNALKIDVKVKTESHVSLKQLVLEGEARHELIYENHANITGVPSGFKDIDLVTCGFQGGNLIILAARPSHGKSSLMRGMSINMAKENYCNLVISLEMSKEQLYDTIISSESGINSVKFRNGYFSKEDWAKKADAASKIYELNSFVMDKDCFTLSDICHISRKLKKKEDIKAIFIDYLQLIEGDQTKTKNYEIGEISRRLKILAKELDLPIIILSQLNRKCEERNDKRPILADLRDSGSLEQDSDIVMFLYRHEQYIQKKYHGDGSKTDDMLKWEGKSELDIAKQRMGPTRRINLVWESKTVTFRDAVFNYGENNQ